MTGKQLFVRTAITIGLPFILIWAFVGTVLHEMRRGFYYGWLDVRANVKAYRREMGRDDYGGSE